MQRVTAQKGVCRISVLCETLWAAEMRADNWIAEGYTVTIEEV